MKPQAEMLLYNSFKTEMCTLDSVYLLFSCKIDYSETHSRIDKLILYGVFLNKDTAIDCIVKHNGVVVDLGFSTHIDEGTFLLRVPLDQLIEYTEFNDKGVDLFNSAMSTLVLGFQP